MKLIHFSSLLLVTSLFFSCEKEIELDEDQIKSRIVVNSVFAADKSIWIHLSESRNILDNNGGALPNIEDATAKLFNDNNTELGTFTHVANGSYVLTSPMPVAGSAYTLKVTHPNFDDISTTSAAPNLVSILEIDTAHTGEQFNIYITVNDNANETNYYSLVITNKVTNTWEVEPGVFETSTNYYNNWICTKDIDAEGSADPSGEICSQELLFSDKNFNGSQHTFNVSEYYDANTELIMVSLRSMSADLFKYRVTFSNYEQNSGNPFGEPVQVYSNVENGFGIFSGYSEYQDSIVF